MILIKTTILALIMYAKKLGFLFNFRFYLLFPILFLVTCGPNNVDVADLNITCGTAIYQTSDLNFDKDDLLEFNVRFVCFVDSLGEDIPDYDSVIYLLNTFFKPALFKFHLHSEILVVDSIKKQDMPSFVKYHLREFRNDSTITVYIYGNDQPNYSNDLSNINGSAGGIGSNFCAIKRKYLYSSTIVHEFGHMFFLMHTQTPDPTSKGLTYLYGDRICDVIKTEGIDYSKIDSCVFKGDLGIFTEEELTSGICNFMSRSYKTCRKCISAEQIARMRFYIDQSPIMQQAVRVGLKDHFYLEKF